MFGSFTEPFNSAQPHETRPTVYNISLKNGTSSPGERLSLPWLSPLSQPWWLSERKDSESLVSSISDASSARQARHVRSTKKHGLINTRSARDHRNSGLGIRPRPGNNTSSVTCAASDLIVAVPRYVTVKKRTDELNRQKWAFACNFCVKTPPKSGRQSQNHFN